MKELFRNAHLVLSKDQATVLLGRIKAKQVLKVYAQWLWMGHFRRTLCSKEEFFRIHLLRDDKLE
jgi:hypothetical protein